MFKPNLAVFCFPPKKYRKRESFEIYSFQAFKSAENVFYTMVIDPQTGLEDRVSTLESQIGGFLGYDDAIREIVYNPKSNPNRISIDFVDYQTKNAERIELFCNARESEWVQRKEQETGDLFVCSEHIRQVTFGTGSEVGIPRQVVGNYAHFWTWRPDNDDDDGTTNNNRLQGNLLTAAYLDPQDAMFFDEPNKPVGVYSHILKATKKQ